MMYRVIGPHYESPITYPTFEAAQRVVREMMRHSGAPYIVGLEHGDPVISGVDPKVVEDKPSSYTGPRCGYTIRTKAKDVEGAEACGSPEVVWNVTGYPGSAGPTPICPKHINDVWKEPSVDSAEPIKK